MTLKQGRIPVPLMQRLRRLRYRVVPVLTFALAVAGTMWLWGRQTAMPNAIGAVDAVRYDITSPGDSLLVWEGRPIDLFDEIRLGQVVARLDDAPQRAALAALQGDLAALTRRVAAEEAQLRFAQAQRQQDLKLDHRRSALDVERMRLTLLDRKAQLESEKISLQRRDEQLAAMKRLVESNAATEVEYLAIKLERDVTAQRLSGLEQTIQESQAKFNELEKNFEAAPDAARAQVEAIIAPLREAIAAQAARVQAIESQIKLLVVRAPAAGVVAAVHRRPGQPVRAGEPILTIADPAARRVISYVRADQRVDPAPGMEVVIRSRTDPRRYQRSKVSLVGAQVELVPQNQLRSSTVQEWGLPVSIELPADTYFRPGEVVDLVLVR